MKYTKLGNSDLNVSRICMGCMGFGNAATLEKPPSGWKKTVMPNLNMTPPKNRTKSLSAAWKKQPKSAGSA